MYVCVYVCVYVCRYVHIMMNKGHQPRQYREQTKTEDQTHNKTTKLQNTAPTGSPAKTRRTHGHGDIVLGLRPVHSEFKRRFEGGIPNVHSPISRHLRRRTHDEHGDGDGDGDGDGE